MSRVFRVSVREVVQAGVFNLGPGEFVVSDNCAAAVMREIAEDTELYDRIQGEDCRWKLVHPDD